MVDATVVVIGAGGGIGGALVSALEISGRFSRIHALSSRALLDCGPVIAGAIGLTNEASIATAP